QGGSEMFLPWAGAARCVARRPLTFSGQETKMDKDRVEGSAKNIKGRAKDKAGKALGDSKMQAEGKAEQMAGKIQNTVGGSMGMMRVKDGTESNWRSGRS